MIDCCDDMKASFRRCEQHGDRCPERLIWEVRGLPALHYPDGSVNSIRHCPWCGTDLVKRKIQEMKRVRP